MSSSLSFTNSDSLQLLALLKNQNDHKMLTFGMYLGYCSHESAIEDTYERGLPEMLHRVARMMGEVSMGSNVPYTAMIFKFKYSLCFMIMPPIALPLPQGAFHPMFNTLNSTYLLQVSSVILFIR